MIRTTTEQVIERPAAEIWAYAADLVRHSEWMNVTDPRITQGRGTDVGSRGRERLAVGPFKWDAEIEVTEAVPGRRIVWRSVAGVPFDAEISLDLDPTGPTSTRARYGATIELHGFWRLLSPMLAAEARSGPERELRRLKDHVERAAAPAAAPGTPSEVR